MAAGAIAGLPPRVGAKWEDLDVCADAVVAYTATLPGRGEPTQKGLRPMGSRHGCAMRPLRDGSTDDVGPRAPANVWPGV
jgi:hypothetical protein